LKPNVKENYVKQFYIKLFNRLDQQKKRWNMEKPYLNITELSIILGQGRRYANYYIPKSGRDVLIPTHLVKKELKIKEIILDKAKVGGHKDG